MPRCTPIDLSHAVGTVDESKLRRRNRGGEALCNDCFVPKQLGVGWCLGLKCPSPALNVRRCPCLSGVGCRRCHAVRYSTAGDATPYARHEPPCSKPASHLRDLPGELRAVASLNSAPWTHVTTLGSWLCGVPGWPARERSTPMSCLLLSVKERPSEGRTDAQLGPKSRKARS